MKHYFLFLAPSRSELRTREQAVSLHFSATKVIKNVTFKLSFPPRTIPSPLYLNSELLLIIIIILRSGIYERNELAKYSNNENKQ